MGAELDGLHEWGGHRAVHCARQSIGADLIHDTTNEDEFTVEVGERAKSNRLIGEHLIQSRQARVIRLDQGVVCAHLHHC